MMMIMLLLLELSKIIEHTMSQGIPSKNTNCNNGYQNLLHVDENEVKDLLNREKDANVLASYIIRNANANHTTGVAIAGEWGAGKTVFLNYLYSAFCNNGIIPIKFDPWTDKSTDIQSDFFRLLKDKVNNEENFELTSALESYMDSISVTSANNWFSLLLMTSKYIFRSQRKSVLEQRNNLISMMRKRVKPVAIFIDDCDRLDSESLKDTFSLIRTTADFPNLIIVAAYDTRRVDYLLEREGGRFFIKKMFNLTHVLPKLSDCVARKFLVDNIIDVHRLPVMKMEMPFEQIAITNYLPTLRDCKAYLNMVHEDYIPYIDKPDRDALAWSKWLLLELLKFIDRYTYQRLKESPQDFFDVKYEHEVIDEYYVTKKDIGLSEDILVLVNAIMSESLMKTYFFDIRIPEIYHIYFSSENLDIFLSEDYFRTNIDIPLENRVNTLKVLLKDNNTNIKQLVAEHIFIENDNCKALSLLVDMLEAYVANISMSSLSDITRRTEYKKYVAALARHPFLGSLAERIIDNELYVEGGPQSIVHESASVYIESTIHSYAVLAIMADVMKHKDVASYLGVDEFFIDKLKSMTSANGVNIEDIGWICGDCVAPCLYDKFLTEFLDNHFLDVLPMTMTFNHQENEPYVVARHDGLKALFDTYENYKSFIARWQKEQRFDKDLLKQHYNLVFFTGMLNKDNAGRFLQSQYPALKPYDKFPIFRAPFSSVTISMDFWQNESRIKHDDEFYFAMDAN